MRPQPRVRNKKAHEQVTTVTPVSPGIPRAMVLTVSFVLSPVTGLFCHRHQRSCLRQLDASVGASGPHDFAVRKHTPSSLAPPASTASRPTLVTCATPLSRDRTAGVVEVIWVDREAEYFLQRDWTNSAQTNEVICPSGKSISVFRHCEPAGRRKGAAR